ncbi:MAG: hypothetical protein NVS1B4_13780 [Gemmatimonadaceae bacterium]
MTATRPDVGVIVVAGGRGSRMTGESESVSAGARELKQFRWLAGKPMLLHSLLTFQERTDVAIVVAVLPREYVGDPPPWIYQADLERLLIGVGGRERGDSVWNGLEDLPPDVTIVVVHDAARPLVDAATIDRVIAAAREGTGAVAALPVVDTLKEVGDDGAVIRTVPREGLWRAQTPQAFPRSMLEDAYVKARADRRTATDDAGLCEAAGHPVVVVRGSERAVKVTDEADFARLEAWLSRTE